jgi:hypothetical protein
MPMGSVVRGYMVSCHECKSGEACPCIIVGEVVGSTIDEVIREALGSGEVIDRIVLMVGNEFIGFYDPGTNTLHLGVDVATNA